MKNVKIKKNTKLITIKGSGASREDVGVANPIQEGAMENLIDEKEKFPHQLKIVTLKEYKVLVEEGKIEFNNDCQRNLKCDVAFASGIVISALNGYNLGEVIVRDNKGIDMQQRSMSLICYCNNDFPLIGLTGCFEDFNGLYFSMLRPELQNSLLNTSIVLDVCENPNNSTDHFLLFNKNQNPSKNPETFNSKFFNEYSWKAIKKFVANNSSKYYGMCKKLENDLEFKGSEFLAGLCALAADTKFSSLNRGAEAWLNSTKVMENEEVDEVLSRVIKSLDIILDYYQELANYKFNKGDKSKQSVLLGLFWSIADTLEKNPQALEIIDSGFGSRYINKVAKNSIQQLNDLGLSNGTTSYNLLKKIKLFFDKVFIETEKALVNLDFVVVNVED